MSRKNKHFGAVVPAVGKGGHGSHSSHSSSSSSSHSCSGGTSGPPVIGGGTG